MGQTGRSGDMTSHPDIVPDAHAAMRHMARGRQCGQWPLFGRPGWPFLACAGRSPIKKKK